MIKQKKVNNRINDGKGFSTLSYIVIIIFTLLCVLPIIHIIALSFSGAYKDIALIPKGLTFYSYSVTILEPGFYTSFMVSILVSLIGTFLSVITMIFAAYPLSKQDLPFGKSLMMFFIISMLFSGGIVPTFLWFKELNIIDTPIVLILPQIVQVYNMVLLKTFFDNMPVSVEEAAQIDGASNCRVLFQIVVPMSFPIIITVTLFTFVGIWNNYQLALYYLPTKTEFYPMAMYILNYINGSAIFDQFGDLEKYAHKANIQAAIIVLSILPIVSVYPFFLRYFSNGMIMGAVKE